LIEHLKIDNYRVDFFTDIGCLRRRIGIYCKY